VAINQRQSVKSVANFFLKKVRFSLNISDKLGIIQTAIENLECKIGKLKVRSQQSVARSQLPITSNQLPLTNNQLPLTMRSSARRKLQRSKVLGPASLSFEHLNFGDLDLFRI